MPAMAGKTLILVTAPCLQGSILLDIFKHANLQSTDVEVATSSIEAVRNLTSSYQAAISVSHAPADHSSSYLSSVLKLLAPGGSCTLLEPTAQVLLVCLLSVDNLHGCNHHFKCFFCL